MEEFEWAIVANIIDEKYIGADEKIISGFKHFSPNTKVICLPEYGGMGHERIPVLGIHKRSKRYIKVVIATKRLTNFRVKQIYKPMFISYIRENVYYDSWKKESDNLKRLNYFAAMLSNPDEEG